MAEASHLQPPPDPAALPLPDVPGIDVPGIPNPCDLPGVGNTPTCIAADKAGDAAGGVQDAAGAAQETFEFAKDPLGYIAEKMQASASSLADNVLPQLVKLTRPDLTVDWFIDAYAVSFGMAIFVLVALLGWNFVQLARRRVSGDEVLETLGFYVPMFFGGAMFGPLVGQWLVRLSGALSESLIDWGVSEPSGETTTKLKESIDSADPGGIVGGSVVAIIFFFCLIIALIMTFLVLLVMLVTLYMSGALLPLSLVWLANPRQRTKGLKIVMVWVGILFSQVLLFFLLGIAFKMVGGLQTEFDNPGLTTLANLAVAIIALAMATLSPFALLRFAPVGPSMGGEGPSMSLRPSRSGTSFPESSSDSQVAQLARSNTSPPAEGDYGSGASGGSSGGTGGGGGLVRATLERQRPASQPSTSLMEPDLAGAGTGAGAAGGSGAAAGGAATAATGGAAAAAAAGAVAAKGVSRTAQIASSAGDMAATHMDHGDAADEIGRRDDRRHTRGDR